MHTKHKYQGKDLDEIRKAFWSVYRHDKLSSAISSPEKTLASLHTQCRLVQAMYALNDFVAASHAYMYTLPKIEKFIDFLASRRDRPYIASWMQDYSEYTVVMNKDGSSTKMTNMAYLFSHLRYSQMAIAARYFIEYNIQYLEKNKSEKDFPSRKRILASAIWWVNQGLLGRFGLKMPDRNMPIPTTVVFSTFPSSGKSYLVNTANEMFMELNYIINRMGGFLRVGNEQSNIFRQSRQTMAMIENPDILDIYPENSEFFIRGSYRPFGKSSEEEWGLNGVQYDPATAIFKTRDSAINSVRCKIAAMDDPSRGQQECENAKIHSDIVQLYRGDFSDRFKNQADKFIILTGTMFNPNDVFSVEAEAALKEATKDPIFDNTYISKDKKTVVILNDCEDEKGESAYPEFISTEELKKKKEGLSPYTYACVWRQKPIPPEGLIFDYRFLRTYEELPADDLTQYSFAYVDPTRRSAKDFFAMPICKFNAKSEDYYLIDAICKQKSSRDLIDELVAKIVAWKIVRIVIEENVDASLAALLSERLSRDGVRFCEITQIYNTVPKAQRIAEQAYTVKNSIVFPSVSARIPSRDVSIFMKCLTDYTSTGKTLHDDPPDAICGFAKHIITGGNRKNAVSIGKKLPF